MKIVNVMASSLDGRIGLHDSEGDLERQFIGLSGEKDQIFLRNQIEQSDAIIVGASSIRANGECLDHPGSSGGSPTWYIFARNDLPTGIKFWEQTHIPRVIVSQKPLTIPQASGVTNLIIGDTGPALFLTRHMAERGHKLALLFGGGIVNRWFYQEKLVDELFLTIAPVFIAKSHAPFLVAPELGEMVKFSLLTSHVEESFVFLKYQVWHAN